MFRSILKKSNMKKSEPLHDLVIGETLPTFKTHIVISHTQQIQNLKDAFFKCYQEKHRIFVKELDSMDTDELIEIACAILCDALCLVRALGWANKNSHENYQLRGWLSSEIADSTHNLPSAIQSKNDFDLKMSIAEFLCLIDALQQNFELIVRMLRDNILAMNLETFLQSGSKCILDRGE